MTKNNLLTEQLNYTGESQLPTLISLCSYKKDAITYHKEVELEHLEGQMEEDAINWILVTGMKDTGKIKELCQMFRIDFLTTQDLLNPEHPAKIEEHDDYNVIIIKLLCVNHEKDYEYMQLCIIQGKRFVMTFTEKETDFFNDILLALNKNTLKIRHRQSDYLLSVLLNSSMANFMSALTTMEDELEDMEEALIVPGNPDTPGIGHIQKYRRNYRIIKKCIFPMKEHINKLFHADNELLNEQQRPFFNDVNDHLQFVLQTMESCRDLITAIVDLYISKNDQHLNDIMKQLTIVSTIFIPLTFLAGIWGMNFEWMPELHWQYGYVMAWGLMLTMGISLFFFFKHKKW